MRRTIATTVCLAVSLLAAATAPAAEAPTREEYVTGLEKICKPDAEATQRAMKGARADIRAERFDVAAKKFAKATVIFGANVKEISAEPRPSADAERLRKWFTYLKRQESYLGEITAQLRQDHPTKALRLIQRFIHTGNQANNVVLAFGFRWCSFEFSRYG
ncbi:MAG TPA: hypothetical protein VFU11_13125 [Solirubrobacterales bacterium]|nr:hypothetical protein [Solirubrobacterales bacterium]